MIDTATRTASRSLMIKIAKDAFVHRMAAQFISQFQHKLNHLAEGDKFDPVADGLPVGKELFLDWVKSELDSHRYVELRGLLDNPPLLKQYALQVADAIGKSSTNIKNPMKDYGITDTEIFEVKGKTQGVTMEKKAEQANNNLYPAPIERSRHCPEHPGAMLRRVSDNTYQCPIEGSVYSSSSWKDQFSYSNGHEINYDNTENRSTPNWNKMHPLPSFLSKEPQTSSIEEAALESLTSDEIYDVFEDNEEGIEPSAPASNKEASINLTRLSKKIKRKDGTSSERGLWDNIRANKGSDKKPTKQMLEQAKKITQSASTHISEQLFAPTTMTSRQCPDHPGQQLIRIEDSVRQCGLDGQIYDFARGFNTYDGKHHNGGSVQGQSVFASSDTDELLAKIARKAVVTTQDSQKLTQLLYQILQYLPANSRERQILNYKFSNNISIEAAMSAIEEHERLQTQTPPLSVAQPSPPTKEPAE